MYIKRRLGDSPRERGSTMSSSCPDIFELIDGRFLVIGTKVTAAVLDILPDDAGIAEDEEAVVVTRDTLVRARRDIPEV